METPFYEKEFSDAVIEFNVFHIIQKTLNTNECSKSFFVNYNTLLHVSTLLGHLQGETFRCRYTRLHYRVKRECAVDCALLVQAETTTSSRLHNRRSAHSTAHPR
jgi:hypothetical protein